MKFITRDTDYAVRALCCLAQHCEVMLSVTELVKDTRIPRPFLRKILQLLTNKKIVKSYKGKGGGFALLRDPRKITLLEIINACQGPVELCEHTFKKRKCPRIKRCRLKRKIEVIEKDLKKAFTSVTLASLL